MSFFFVCFCKLNFLNLYERNLQDFSVLRYRCFDKIDRESEKKEAESDVETVFV